MAEPPELNDAQVLERKPVGASVTLRVLGGCMYPLFRSGDSVTVRRCEERDIARGDVAITLSWRAMWSEWACEMKESSHLRLASSDKAVPVKCRPPRLSSTAHIAPTFMTGLSG